MEKLLKSYPDYGKAPEGYLAGIVEILERLSPDVVDAVMDIETGVRSRCEHLPTIADIVKFAEEYTARRHQFDVPHRVESIYRRVGVAAPEPPDVTGEEPLRPHEHRVYPTHRSNEVARLSHPHKAPGRPWEVKPHGYWTAWTPEQRDEHDRKQVAAAKPTKIDNYDPKDASELRTLARPVSQALKDLIKFQDENPDLKSF